MNQLDNFEILSASILGALILATALIWGLKFSPKQAEELKLRMKTWWYIFIFLLGGLMLPSPSFAICTGLISFLALKEYLSLIPTRRADRRVLLWAYLAIPIQYYFVQTGWYGMSIVFIPVWMFILLPIRMILIGETSGFLKALSELHWGLMINVFAISHILMLATLKFPSFTDHKALILFLIVATEMNDVFRYVSGKLFGKHKIIPKVSPNKTWEGFLGGVILTSTLFYFVGPYMTPLNHNYSLALGVCLAVAGFFGDLSISALKRDIGVKDSGNLLPGHGGLLDRIDSLCFTALIYFHFIHYFAV